MCKLNYISSDENERMGVKKNNKKNKKQKSRTAISP